MTCIFIIQHSEPYCNRCRGLFLCNEKSSWFGGSNRGDILLCKDGTCGLSKASHWTMC